jgi:hypothetical protein
VDIIAAVVADRVCEWVIIEWKQAVERYGGVVEAVVGCRVVEAATDRQRELRNAVVYGKLDAWHCASSSSRRLYHEWGLQCIL